MAGPTKRDIFIEALQKESASERAAYLQAACGDDRELRQQVEELLAAHEKDSSFILDRPPEVTLTVNMPGVSEKPGTQIGPYKLLQQIGEGGMGVVYMAEQTEPVRRRVALKIIKPGMDTRQVIARFEAERQALAVMDHPHIAKVYNAGTTDSGRPYFVMELVNGLPITRYCDEQHLTPRERLELFVPVCQAVQHAHQKGIIHRDLKPSNILVALYDQKPVPKVIDFGVAKATSQSLTEKTLFTELGQIVGTLEYMSSEQAQRNQLDIDTRSDIYSLGVVLYELLTGTTPLDRKRLRSAAYDEILRLIREEETPRPSLRLSTIDTLPSIAANRRTEPLRLRKLLRGELDWIVMKALEKDRARRYETASGFAADIQHYLLDEPVVACPPSATYRLRKFAKKNRKLITTILTIAAVLLVATAFSTWWAVRATRAESAERVVAQRNLKLAEENAALAAQENAARHQAEANAHEAVQQKRQAEENAAVARRNQYIAHMQQVRLEWKDSNLARIEDILDLYRSPATPESDLRGWEWQYWDRMCHLDLRTLEGHTGPVHDVAFSPDSALVASAGQDGTVRIWRVADGSLVTSLAAHKGPAICVAFHPNGKQVGTGGADKFAVIWDWESGEEILRSEHVGPVICVAFSPDAKLFASGTVGTREGRPERKVWNLETLQVQHTLPEASVAGSLEFSPDSQRLVCAVLQGMEVWDLNTGELRSISGNTEQKDNNLSVEPTTDVVQSPDGLRLATAAADRKVRLFDAATGAETLSIPAHTEAVSAVAFHPQRPVVASASVDRTIRFWSTENGADQMVLKGHQAQVNDIEFSPDGMRLASASGDGTVKIWDTLQPMDARFVLMRGSEHMLSLRFRTNSTQLAYTKFAGLGDETAQWGVLQDLAEQKNIREFRGGHSHWVRAAAVSDDGRLFATAGGSTVQIWDAATGELLHRIDGHANLPNDGVSFSPDGKLLLVDSPNQGAEAGTRTPSHKVYATDTAKLLYEKPVFSGTAVFSPDNGTLAIATKDNEIQFLEAATGAVLKTLSLETRCRELVFAPSGEVLSALVGNDLILFRASTGEAILTIPDAGRCIGFDEHATRVFTTPLRLETQVLVWHTTTGDLLNVIEPPARSTFSRVAMSTDGSFIAFKSLPYIHALDVRPPSAAVAVQRESQAIVAQLLRLPLDVPPYVTVAKAEILGQLNSLRSINESVRSEAAGLIDSVLTPYVLSMEMWAATGELLEDDPSEEHKQQALDLARLAYATDVNAKTELGLGAALFTSGFYQESIEYLERGIVGVRRIEKRSEPTWLSLLARAVFHVGDVERAKQLLADAQSSPDRHIPDNAEAIQDAVELIEAKSKRLSEKPLCA